MMIPLTGLLLLVIVVGIKKYLELKKYPRTSPSLPQMLKTALMDGKVDEAKRICRISPSPVSRVLEHGLSSLGSPLEFIQVSLENAGRAEMSRLEKRLTLMATISRVAPLLGFLGSIFGLIQIVGAMDPAQSYLDPSKLSRGLMQAYITSGFGLIVSVVATLLHNYFVNVISVVRGHMQGSALKFMEIIQEPAK